MSAYHDAQSPTNQKVFLIRVRMKTNGQVKGQIEGNQTCWFGMFEFCVKDQLEDPDRKLLCQYVVRDRKYQWEPH